MLNIVLFGPPGAGKGTQAAKLVEKYDLVHLSTGDIFRFNIKGGSELGILAKGFMDKGELVPDEVTIAMLKAEVEKYPLAAGFIFDGFPRTTVQAEALEKFLDENDMDITVMLSLKVSDEALVRRLLLRGKDSGRADDANEEVIQNRIAVYNKQTAVVASFYDERDKYMSVDGEGSIEEVFSRLQDAVQELA